MRLGFALYDPAFLAEDGSYWTWAHPLIDRKVLDTLYYQVVRKSVPESESSLREAELIGGYISVAEGHFYFRILDGGRDRQNRPGRFVILFACSIGDDRAALPDMVWRSRIFDSLAAEAKRKCPVPVPSDLCMEIEPPTANADDERSRELQKEHLLKWKNGDDFSEFMRLCAHLPTGEWKATIQLGPHQRQAEVTAFKFQARHFKVEPSADELSAQRPVQLQKRTALSGVMRGGRQRWVLVAALLMAVVPVAMLVQTLISSSNPAKAIADSDNSEIKIHQITRTKRFEHDRLSPGIAKSMEIRFQVAAGLLQGDQLLSAEVEILAADSRSLAYKPVAAHATSKHQVTIIERQTRMVKVDFFYQEWLHDTFILRLTLKSSGGNAIVFKSKACSVE